MALLEVRTEWAVYKNCFLRVAKYKADSSRAIEIWNKEDEIVIDTNNCPWAIEFIKNNGLGKVTGRTVRSGYCMYPVAKLNVGEIVKYLEAA